MGETKGATRSRPGRLGSGVRVRMEGAPEAW